MTITNKDIEKLKEHFATKVDLEKTVVRFENTVRQFKDEIMTGMDKVMKELKDMREERYMLKTRVDRIEQKLDEHIKLPVHAAHPAT